MPKNKKPTEKEARSLDWETPPKVLIPTRTLGAGGRITLDPATTPSNPTDARIFLAPPTDNGLEVAWFDPELAANLDGPWLTFVNPPYGKETAPWVSKIVEEARKAKALMRNVPSVGPKVRHDVRIVALLSVSRTEQYYFQQLMAEANMVCWVRARIHFRNPETGKTEGSNNSTSAIWGFNVPEKEFIEAYSGLGMCVRVTALSPPVEHSPWSKPRKKAAKKTQPAPAPAPPPDPFITGILERSAQAEAEPEMPDPFCDDAEPLADDEPACPVCLDPLTDGACPQGHEAPPDEAKTKSHWGGAGVRRALPVAPAGVPGIPDLEAWKAGALDELDGRPVIVSVSGGKDSTALALLLKEAGIPYRNVHFDTGWEHEETERYVRDYLPGIIGPIEILQSHLGGMESLVLHRGMFPSRIRRFCTQELKVRPFIRYLRALQKGGEDPVNAVGIRAGESKARSVLGEWEENKDFDCTVWRPLIAWSEQDVIDMHHRHGVKPNPLYLRGATRVGCWPCIFARKKEIRMIADLDPERIDRLRALEEAVQEQAAKRYAAEGETFESKGYVPPTWFQNPAARANKKTGKRSGRCWPIDKVVGWARTKRGGKEPELFAPPYAEEGCMRWGLCETVPPEQEAENAAAYYPDHGDEMPDIEMTITSFKVGVTDPALEGFS